MKMVCARLFTFLLIGCSFLAFTHCEAPGDTTGYSGTNADVENGGYYPPVAIEPKFSYEPMGIPIKFTFDGKGNVSASWTRSIVTFIGRFSLSFTQDLYKKSVRPFYAQSSPQAKPVSLYEQYRFDELTVEDRPDIQNLLVGNNDIVVAIIRDEQNVDVFLIEDGVELELVTEGLNRTRVKRTYVEIDVHHAKIRELVLTQTDKDKAKSLVFPKERYSGEMVIHEDIFSDPGVIDVPIAPKAEAERRLTQHYRLPADLTEIADFDTLRGIQDSVRQQNRPPY